MGKTLYARQAFDKGLTHQSGAFGAGIVTPYVGLATAVSDELNGALTEVTGGGYTRRLADNTSWGSPDSNGQVATGAALSFVTATSGGYSSGNPIPYFFLADASTSGNILVVDALTDGVKGWGTVDSATDIITIPGHGFADGNVVYLKVPNGAVAPTGATLGLGTQYFVKTGTTTATGFKIASGAAGNAAVDFTGSGSVFVKHITPVTVNAGDTPQFASGALSFQDG